MKKLTFSFNLILAFVFYILLLDNQTPGGFASSLQQATATALSLPSIANLLPIRGGPNISTLGKFKNGTFIGTLEGAFYGNVQVQADIQNGQLVNVEFLQYPNLRNASRRTNSQAIPTLTREAVQMQNSNVNVVSGATDTSAAFQQSLGAALAQAKA
jgi:uncharacterized protein with FMN-binding domain